LHLDDHQRVAQLIINSKRRLAAPGHLACFEAPIRRFIFAHGCAAHSALPFLDAHFVNDALHAFHAAPDVDCAVYLRQAIEPSTSPLSWTSPLRVTTAISKLLTLDHSGDYPPSIIQTLCASAQTAQSPNMGCVPTKGLTMNRTKNPTIRNLLRSLLPAASAFAAPACAQVSLNVNIGPPAPQYEVVPTI
jgi:hypothetical protein